ncbi:hypothetical protein K438DRAFT_1943549 [Mycena galopus ATCC 62051]|nr:hypothetical protein K438DRAFT_1943549 [Mycena galopus ATCC 62051]
MPGATLTFSSLLCFVLLALEPASAVQLTFQVARPRINTDNLRYSTNITIAGNVVNILINTGSKALPPFLNSLILIIPLRLSPSLPLASPALSSRCNPTHPPLFFPPSSIHSTLLLCSVAPLLFLFAPTNHHLLTPHTPWLAPADLFAGTLSAADAVPLTTSVPASAPATGSFMPTAPNAASAASRNAAAITGSPSTTGAATPSSASGKPSSARGRRAGVVWVLAAVACAPLRSGLLGATIQLEHGSLNLNGRACGNSML